MATDDSVAHIADLVDALLVAHKQLVGIPSWQPGNREGEKRLDWPVLIGGETADCRVSATAYPDWPELRFNIALNFHDQNVWRIDHNPKGRIEINRYKRGHPLSGVLIDGAHYHAWADNREEATRTKIPDPLPWRRKLPMNLRNWGKTFRWFLGEINIAQPRVIPDMPKRTRLL